jgi:hypothetical protein
MREIKFRGKKVNGGEWVKNAVIDYYRQISKEEYEIQKDK